MPGSGSSSSEYADFDDLSDWAGFGLDSILDKYKIIVESSMETEVIMISKKFLKENLHDQMFWCLAKQYERKRFPKLNKVIEQILQTLQWEKFKKKNLDEIVEDR